jgi:hypothetical protein
MTAQGGAWVVCVEHAGDRDAVAGISYGAGSLGRARWLALPIHLLYWPLCATGCECARGQDVVAGES